MGLFSFIKTIRAEKKRKENFIQMTPDELQLLSEEELLEALLAKDLDSQNKLFFETNDCLQQFQGAKRIFYIVNTYDSEVQNGGLCQFFVNSSREVAPYLLEALHTIGADTYSNMLTDFITTHKISLDDLSSFILKDVSEFEDMEERFPFDDFDDAYYELYETNSLEKHLLEYAKAHLQDFS